MSNFSLPDKLNLAQSPTPIQRLNHLSRAASKFREVNLFVKRDDLTHGPAAGNKVRKLEFLLAEALAKGLKVVFTCGAIQSNHARATAVLCRELGLECVLFLHGRPPLPNETPQGNLLLSQMEGARIIYVSSAQYNDIGKTFMEFAEEYRQRDGKMPLLVPEGGSNDIGTLGYVAAFQEIASQAGASGLPGIFDSIVLASGSGGTQAGLIIGRNLSSWEDHCHVISFNVGRTAPQTAERVKISMAGTIQRHRIPISFMPADIHVMDGYVGPGYAQATPELYRFIVKTAREDGVLLDPVYTGKALFGLISELNASPARTALFGKNILFIHTGGLPSLFAHAAEFRQALSS